jgi:hypothetical protein
MASRFQFMVDTHDDLIIVTEPRFEFYAMYEKQPDKLELVLVRRSDFADDALLVAAWRAANAKARELGWIV